MSDEYGRLCVDSARPPRFIIGRDSDGRWVVCDRRALCGGSFVNREDAVRYARFESEGIPGQVTLSSDIVHFEVAPRRAPGGHGCRAKGDQTSNDDQVGDASGRREVA